MNARQDTLAKPAASPWGTWRNPPSISIYGPTGCGKSSDFVWAFAETGCVLAEHIDGVKIDKRVVGWELADHQIRGVYNISGAIQCAHHLAQNEKGRYLAVGLDDASLLAENELATMKASGAYTRGDGYDWSLYLDLSDRIRTLLEIIRFGIDAIAVLNWHVRPGEVKKGVYYRGGPWLPSIKRVEPTQHGVSSVWKAEMETNRPWPWVYRCEPDPAWVMKDRHALRGVFPLNLGEALRHVGYVIPRPRELAWIDDWVETFAGRLAEGKDRRELSAKAKQLLGNVPEQHAYWVIRDGLDRADFRARGGLLDFV